MGKIKGCLLVILYLLNGCTTWIPVEYAQNSDGVSVLFMADPQFHNMHGATLQFISLKASRAAKVAMRPPELNLLSKYAFIELAQKAKNDSGGEIPLVVLLGDVSDIGCSGEFGDFEKTKMEALGKDTAWIVAHGNHDTYMQGVVNSFIPTDWKMPQDFESAPLPVDATFWTSQPQMDRSGPTWQKACFPGTPLNKISWIAKYTNSLKENHVTLEAHEATDSDGYQFQNFKSVMPSQGGLANFNFSLEGKWVRPEVKATDAYNSFLLQTLDIGRHHKLILLDTSVCSYAAVTWAFPIRNAGSRGCIGKPQIDMIKQIAKKNDKERTLIFAGHIPLDGINHADRKELLGVFAADPKTIYLSAHSHESLRAKNFENGLEINVGSTTDWPMEAHLFQFQENGEQVRPLLTFDFKDYGRVTYKNAKLIATYELCRHLPAARKLANIKVDELGDEWKTPDKDKDCDDKLSGSHDEWLSIGAELDRYIDKINFRYFDENDKGYKEAILKIVASASYYFDAKPDYARFLPPYNKGP